MATWERTPPSEQVSSDGPEGGTLTGLCRLIQPTTRHPGDWLSVINLPATSPGCSSSGVGTGRALFISGCAAPDPEPGMDDTP